MEGASVKRITKPNFERVYRHDFDAFLLGNWVPNGGESGWDEAGGARWNRTAAPERRWQ